MNPSIEGSAEVSLTTRVKHFLDDTARRVEDDITSRGVWVDWQDYYERRRYCQEFRNPEWPWPGSSDIVMPLIDKVIKKGAPRFYETLLGDRPVNADAMDRDSQANAPSVEMFLAYLLQSRETNALQQWAYHIDDLQQHGWAVMKSVWAYERRPAPIHLRRDKLPASLQKIIPAKDEAQADALSFQAQQAGRPLAILTEKELRAKDRRPAAEAMIRVAYGLTDERHDEKAVKEIFEWFASGAREVRSVMGSASFVNQPAAFAVSPYDFIFPQNTTEIQQTERATHRMRMGRQELIRHAIAGEWNMSLLKEILNSHEDAGRRGTGDVVADMHIQSERDRHNLTSIGDDEEHILYEVFTWMSETEFGPQKKVSYIVHKDRIREPLTFRVWSRDSGRFPFHITKMESGSRRIMGSRGIPEMLNDIDAEITLNHRAKHNRAQVATSPSFAYRPGSGFNPENVRWIPGGMYPTQRPGQDIAPLPVPPMDAYEDREEAVLRTWAEEYVGSPDFGLSNPLSNLSEARTAKEIGAIESAASMGAMIAGSDFGDTVAEVCDEYFDMYHSFGPEELWVARTAAPPMRLAKADLRGNFSFSMSSQINTGGPAGKAQRAQQRLALIIQAQLPQIIGDKYELDLGEAIRDWLERSDPRFAARVLRERTPQEIQQRVQERQRIEEMQKKALTNQALSPEDMEETLKSLQKDAPHGKSQQIDLSQVLSG